MGGEFVVGDFCEDAVSDGMDFLEEDGVPVALDGEALAVGETLVGALCAGDPADAFPGL